MKLVYTDTGKEVKVGDKAQTFRGEMAEVHRIDRPHKAAEQN